MNRDSNKLETGSKIAVIGGGPAGSFFTLSLLYYAQQRGIQPDITIYQGRNFDELGPKGCKGCAGILSMSLLRNLSELNLTIPEEIIQAKIERFTVHSPYNSITLTNPEKGAQIFSIYRGGGPRESHYENRISFDGWLLREAQKRGARVENQNISRIYLKSESAIEVAEEKIAYDLIVLASGINSKPVTISGLKYLPPKKQLMAQDELYAGADEVASRLGGAAHIFLIPHSGIIFGSLVPKGSFINVSILSSGQHPVSVTSFLNQDIVRQTLPEHYERACGCRPWAATSAVGNFYADRFVAVGDAAVTRLYKDGIGSSLLTAREAARTVVYHGLKRRDFERHYQPFCHRLDQDNRWGRRLFSLNDKAKDSRTFFLAQHQVIGDEQNNARGSQPHTKATWGMFTGSYSYRQIAAMTFSPIPMAKLLAALFRENLRSLLRKRATSPKKLMVGSKKVLILGSGFGGTYVLRHLVPALNRNENVETTMVSDENFFLFSPLLHEVAMGRIETRHIAYPIRRLQWRDRFNFVQAGVEKIDVSNHKVITSRGTLDFDYLVLALGSVTNMSGLDSPGGKVFTLKTLRDSMLMRNHVIGVFEQASIEKKPAAQQQLLTFVVTGGGYTGIQLVTELRDFIYGGLIRFYKTVDPANIRIILAQAEPKIVAELDTRLGTYIMKQLQRMGIEVRTRTRVTRVGEDQVEINGEEKIPTRTVIWVSGVVANPKIAELSLEKDDIGRVLVNEHLEVPEVSGVYAVGDCAHFEDPRTGQPIPPRAHTTVRQARIAANNILAEIRGRDKKPYRYSSDLQMVSLGGSKAVFRYRRLRLYGLVARLIWLAGYSLLVTGGYNRSRILMDWLFSLLFGRDTAYLKLTDE